jgi:hypothetical protein
VRLTAKAWNSPPADSKPLSELMKSFGCADVIAPVDVVTFGRRASELICRKKAPTGTPTAAGKYRLRALQCFETAAQTPDPYAKDMLTVAAREFLRAAFQDKDGEF